MMVVPLSRPPRDYLVFFRKELARSVIPARYVQLAASEAEGAGSHGADLVTRSGWVPADVLLVEDNLIIALDTEDILRNLGVRSVRTASGVTEALREIGERRPEFALLDVNLGAETSFEIAARLSELKVRFAFATGYGEQVAFPDALAAVPKYRKPYTADELHKAIGNEAS